MSRSGIHYSLNDPISLIYHFTFLLDLFRSIQNPAKHLRWGVFQNRVNAWKLTQPLSLNYLRTNFTYLFFLLFTYFLLVEFKAISNNFKKVNLNIFAWVIAKCCKKFFQSTTSLYFQLGQVFYSSTVHYFLLKQRYRCFKWIVMK